MKNIIIVLLLLIGTQVSGQSVSKVYRQINIQRVLHGRWPILKSNRLKILSGDWIAKMEVKYPGRLVHDKLKLGRERFEILSMRENPVKSWMRSEPHRRAILSMKVLSIGISYSDGIYCARLN